MRELSSESVPKGHKTVSMTGRQRAVQKEQGLKAVSINNDPLVLSIRNILKRHEIQIGLEQRLQEQQRELQASEERFRNAIAKNADSIVIVNSQGIVRFANPSAEFLFNCAAEELLGQEFFGCLVIESATCKIDTEIISTVGESEAAMRVVQTQVDVMRRQGEKAIAEMRVVETEWEGEMAFLISLRDITERKRAEEERDRFFTLSLDMLCIAGFDGYFKRLNPSWEKTLGFTKEELGSKPLLEFVHPEDRKLTAQKLAPEGIQNTVAFENRFLCKDGSYRWLWWRLNKFAEQKLYYAVAHDITERKQSEEALKESEARFRDLARREKLLNHLASQIRNSLDLNKILTTAVSEIRSLLQIDRCMFFWYNPDPETPYFELVHEERDPDLSSLPGQFLASEVAGLTKQLMALKTIRADNILTASELDEKTRQMLRSLGITAQLFLPIQTNSGKLGVIGCSHASEARPWLDSEVELLQSVTDQLAIAIDQAELYHQTRAAAATAEAQAQQLSQTLHDLQQTQAQLVQTEKMSSLGQLVAGIAHEINNPVNFIYGNLSHIDNYIQDLLDLLNLYQSSFPQPGDEIEEKREEIDLEFLVSDLPKMLTSMKMGAERIREIVLSLRNFSRVDEAEKKPVNIHEGIDNTLLILRNRMAAKGDKPAIEVIKDYGKLPLVECYAGQLNQVFMNILNNAIDALEENHKTPGIESGENDAASIPTIQIRTAMVAKNRVAIRISDNGPGIPEKVRQRIFEPFFTTKPVGKGTGLGLSISYQIVVEKHGGTFKCISTPGQGTEFWIEIPLEPNLT